MSIYQTPLQFAYFFALLFAVLHWYRGYKEELLSNTLLGFIMFFLAMEIQDYTFGFSGINVLWERFNGFPRSFHLAFAPTIYFYLLSQTNKEFRFTSKEWRHYVPYLIYFVLNIILFIQGNDVVNQYQSSEAYKIIKLLIFILTWISYGYYFYKSLKLYSGYKDWILTQYSNTDAISLRWLRNFIYLLLSGEVFRILWLSVDFVIDLPFEQDWWWHLYTVIIIIYVGIHSYFQRQEKHIVYHASEVINTEIVIESQDTIVNEDKPEKTEDHILKNKILSLFDDEHIYLNPDLSLQDLASKLKTNTSVLSAVINTSFKKNFNDFVNEYRVNAFRKQVKLPANAHLTMLAIAFDCGFNSKSTFNRAYKKVTGNSPSGEK